MKKYISILVSIVMLLSTMCAYAESEGSMSVEVIENSSENTEMTNVNMDLEEMISPLPEQSIQTENSDSPEEVLLDGDIEPYDLEKTSGGDSWTEASDLLIGRADFDLVIVNGSLYAVGGFGDSGYIYSIEKYNENTASWENVTFIPKEVNGFSVVATDADIYIIGGYSNNVYANDVQLFKRQPHKSSIYHQNYSI